MDKTNEGAQEVVVEQEEQATEEVLQEEDTQEETQEDNFVKVPKDRFKSMQRKAMAYDATKRNSSYKPLPAKQESLDEDVVKSVKNLELIEAKRQYGYENNLSPEETDFIFKFTGGKPSKDILTNPFVKSGLEGYRASKRLEANTPSSTTTSKVFQGKEFKEMNEDERRKAFEEASKKFKA